MAETSRATTFEAGAYTAAGAPRERVTLPAQLFDGTVNVPVMHQAVKAYLANQRQGNASTKIRKYVTGGNQKPWRQKGTGRARQGSIRAPHWVGGGTVFGPTPRAYDQYVPRQVRQLARKSALNARAREGAIFVIEPLDYEAPKTKRVVALVDALGLAGQKVLVLTHGVKPNVFLSARNIPTVRVLPYADVSTYHLLWSDAVVIEGSAIGQALEPAAAAAAAPDESAAPAGAAAKRARTGARGAGRGAAASARARARGEPAESAAPAPRARAGAKGGARGAGRSAAAKAAPKSTAKAARKSAGGSAAKRAAKPARRKKKGEE